jgi:nucleotide-binding universal stress UspA family protein
MQISSMLVAYDGTHPSEAALDQAIEVAVRQGAKLDIVCVIPIIAAAFGVSLPPGSSVQETLDAAGKMLSEAKRRAAQKGVSHSETFLLEGDPVDGIIAHAEKHPPDLIVVGSRGLSEAGRFILGSVSDGILHHAQCSVLVVKSGAIPRKARSSKAA